MTSTIDCCLRAGKHLGNVNSLSSSIKTPPLYNMCIHCIVLVMILYFGDILLYYVDELNV